MELVNSETFKDYLKRLRNCKSLPKKVREEAAKQLEEWEMNKENIPASMNYVAYSSLQDAESNSVSARFIFVNTPQGYEFWDKIRNAGF